jgi:hypothetical protein
LRGEQSPSAKQGSAKNINAKKGTALQSNAKIYHNYRGEDEQMKTEEFNETFSILESQDYFNYDTTHQPCELLPLFGHTPATDEELEGMPALAAIKRKESDNMIALDISSAIREKLLDLGRYLGKDKGVYRVYLPSENMKVAENYLKSANRKQARSHRLISSTPRALVPQDTQPSNLSSRAAIAKSINDRLQARIK